MISVFTPSHDPKYLTECYTSLNEQTYEDWEWVVLLNNGAEWTGPKDERVKIQRSTAEGKGVGYYKGQAILQCKGDIFLELDHDDVLILRRSKPCVCNLRGRSVYLLTVLSNQR